MHLDQFITHTIDGIIKGVKNTENIAKENDVIINPLIDTWSHDRALMSNRKSGNREITTVKFNIALYIQNSGSKEEHIIVLSPEVDDKANDKHFYKTVPRVKFNLNMALPAF